MKRLFLLVSLVVFVLSSCNGSNKPISERINTEFERFKLTVEMMKENNYTKEQIVEQLDLHYEKFNDIAAYYYSNQQSLSVGEQVKYEDFLIMITNVISEFSTAITFYEEEMNPELHIGQVIDQLEKILYGNKE